LRFVFRVLAQIAVLAGALDFLREIDFQFTFERGNFVGESLENTILHVEIDFNIPLVVGVVVRVMQFARASPEPPTTNYHTHEADCQPPEPIVGAYRDLARKPDQADDGCCSTACISCVKPAPPRSHSRSVVIARSHLDRETEEYALARSLDRAGVDVASAGDAVFAALSPVRTPSGIVAIALRHPTHDAGDSHAGAALRDGGR
jgi:hypothetical protein